MSDKTATQYRHYWLSFAANFMEAVLDNQTLSPDTRVVIEVVRDEFRDMAQKGVLLD